MHKDSIETLIFVLDQRVEYIWNDDISRECVQCYVAFAVATYYFKS